MHKGRLEAFSDGVVAIIITIMVLELEIPHNGSAASFRGGSIKIRQLAVGKGTSPTRSQCQGDTGRHDQSWRRCQK